MPRLRGAAFVVLLLGAEIAAVITLHGVGWVDGFAVRGAAMSAWLRQASTEDLVAVTARFAALACAWWLLVATVLSLARRVVPGWRHLRALDWLSPAALRRVADRALVAGFGASIGLTGMHPAVAAQAHPAHPARARVDVPVVRTATPTLPRPPTTSGTAPVGASRDTVVVGTVVVRAGENLWVIAQHALEHGQRVVRPAEIAPYWRRVVAANASGLRSHDPNLIFPGERVVLPPLPDGTAGAG